MKCVVFGGAGFIGSHLAERLLALGHAVTVVDDFSSGAAGNLAAIGSKVSLHQADIRSPETFARLDASIEVAFHLAFPTPLCNRDRHRQFHDVATTGTLHILDWCAEHDVRLVYGSSISVYGQHAGGTPISEETPVSPILPYAANKLYGELLATSYASLYGLRHDTIRISDVYGPRDRRRNAVNNFIDAAAAGAAIQLQGDGSQRRNFTYVQDIAEALSRLATSDARGDTLILADTKATAVRELAATVTRVCGSSSAIATNSAADSRDYVFDPAAFLRRFGDMNWTPLEAGIAATARARSNKDD